MSPPQQVAQPDDTGFSAGPSPDRAAAESVGYGIELPDPTAAPPTRQGAWENASEDYKQRYTLAMAGTEGNVVSVDLGADGVLSTAAGGCLADVRRALYGDLEAWTRLGWIASQLEFGQADRVDTDPTWRAAQADWSNCMAGQGYPGLVSSGAAQSLVNGRYAEAATGSPSEQTVADLRSFQLAVATADATCAEQHSINEVWSKAVAAAAESYLSEHESDMLAYAEMMTSAAQKARDLLDN